MIFFIFFLSQYSNIFEAIGCGATEMLLPVGSIVASVIAFVAIFNYLDEACMWFFSIVNLENFGIAVVISYTIKYLNIVYCILDLF